MSKSWSSFPNQSLLVENWRKFLKEEPEGDKEAEETAKFIQDNLAAVMEEWPEELLGDIDAEPQGQLNEWGLVLPGMTGGSIPTWWYNIKATVKDASRMKMVAMKFPKFGRRLAKMVEAMDRLEKKWVTSQEKFVDEMKAAKLTKASIKFMLGFLRNRLTGKVSNLISDPGGTAWAWLGRWIALMTLTTADTLYEVFGKLDERQIQQYLAAIDGPQGPPLQLPAPSDVIDVTQDSADLERRSKKLSHPIPPEDT